MARGFLGPAASQTESQCLAVAQSSSCLDGLTHSGSGGDHIVKEKQGSAAFRPGSIRLISCSALRQAMLSLPGG